MSLIEQLPEDLREPPAHLSAPSREFFSHQVASGPYDAAARVMLIQFLEMRDMIAQCREERKGALTFTDKHGQPREHPLIKIELKVINELGKQFRLLGWDLPPVDSAQGNFFFGAGRRNASN